MNKRELKTMIDQQHESINEHLITIALHGEDNRVLKAKIESLESDKRRMQHSISEIDKYFERVKREIALEIITHGTHRERDLYYKRQVLNMVTMQEVFIQALWESDEIPF